MKKIRAVFLPFMVAGVASLLLSGKAPADDVFVSNNGNSSIEEISGNTPSVFIPTTSDLNGPTGVAVNSSGDLYVANNGGVGTGFIAEFSSTGSFIGDVATNLNGPRGLTFDGNGNLFVADQSNGTIVEIPTGGGASSTIVDSLSSPNGLTFDSAGNLYVTNGTSDSIDKITFSGGAVSSVTPFVTTGLNNPVGIVYDTVGANAGNFFVVDNSDSVVEFTASGSPVPPTPFITELNDSETLDDITVDSAGDFYVTDSNWSSVTEYSSMGVVLNVFNDPGAFDGPCYVTTTTTLAVPEPSTYALLSAGLGLLLFMGRRKTAKI